MNKFLKLAWICLFPVLVFGLFVIVYYIADNFGVVEIISYFITACLFGAIIFGIIGLYDKFVLGRKIAQ